MEKFQLENNQTSNGQSNANEIIKVSAIIKCPSCTYKRKFRNQFHRENIEMMVVSLKVFTWMVCEKCGNLLELDLTFDI
jgi:hypothetical protein